MSSGRVQNVARTFIYGAFSKAISIVLPFVIRTIIIYKLGNEYAGLSSLFTSVLSILNMSELGINSAISFCLYKPVAENDVPTINALMALMKKLYRAIGIFILGAGLLLTPFLDNLISGTYPQDINIYVLYLIYLTNSSVSYLGFAYKSTLFEVNQRGDINYKISSITEIVKAVLQIAVLLIFENYYYYALLLPLASIVVTLITQVSSRKIYPEIVPQGSVSAETKRFIKNKVAYLAASSIATTLTSSVDNLVISSTIGLSALAIYGNYWYIVSAVSGVIIIVYRAILPSMGNSLYTDTEERRYTYFSAIQLLSNWMVTWCAACMICLYQPFMILWVGEENLLGISVVVMIVLYFYINGIELSLTTIYIQASGLWNKTLLRKFLQAGSNLVLDILLARQYGVGGIIFASFITAAIISLPMDISVVYKYVLNQSSFNGLIKSIYQFVICIVICAISYFICDFVHISGWGGLIMKAAVCIVVPNALLVLLSFRTKEFGMLKQWGFSILGVKKKKQCD